MAIKSFRDLIVWTVSMELASDIYRLTRDLPSDERYGIAQQLKRSAVSIPSNIAEGAGYGGATRRNLHHLRISLGSNLELQTQLMLLERLQLATTGRIQPVLARASEVGKMLNGLISSIERNLGPGTPNN